MDAVNESNQQTRAVGRLIDLLRVSIRTATRTIASQLSLQKFLIKLRWIPLSQLWSVPIIAIDYDKFESRESAASISKLRGFRVGYCEQYGTLS